MINLDKDYTNKVLKEFKFLFSSAAPCIAVVAARGGGKTHTALQMVVWRLINGPPNSTSVFFSSTVEQVKSTVEAPMRTILKDFPREIVRYNKTEHTYYFKFGPHDIRQFMLKSYEKPESKRGLHPYTIVLDECGSMPYDLMGAIISPMMGAAMTAGDGKLIAIGTARGKTKFYELFQRGTDQNYPEWESYMIKANRCTLLGSKYLLQMRNELTDAEYRQEFECDFNANALVGSVYGEYLLRYASKRISDAVVYDPSLPVWTSWDLGHSNNTAIWFFQITKEGINFIDFYENSGYDYTHYASEVLGRSYSYAKAILPWDAGAKNFRSPLTVSEMLNNYGIYNVVLPNSAIKTGIDAGRLLLKTASFNATKCALGIRHLENHRFKVDFKTGVDRQRLLHDEHIDGADAYRYAALGVQLFASEKGNVKIISGQDYNVFM
jgi:hypothetical protein